MLTLWYFDGDPIGDPPSHVYTGESVDGAYQALCNRFGAHLFDHDSEYPHLEKGNYVIELPADSRVAVIKREESPTIGFVSYCAHAICNGKLCFGVVAGEHKDGSIDFAPDQCYIDSHGVSEICKLPAGSVIPADK